MPTKKGTPKAKKAQELVTESVAPSVIPTQAPAFTDNCDRGVLAEGRNYGVGFAMCRKNPDGSIQNVGPQSPCKDYMNDQVYSEWTGKPYRAWGYSAKKEGILDGVMGFIAFKILPYKHEKELRPQQVKERDWLAVNYKKVEEFIKQIELMLNIKLFNTEVIKVGEHQYVAQVPNFWVEYPYRVSLWSLLVRFCIESFWMEGDVIKAIEKCRTGDGTMLETALPKLKRMIAGERPDQGLATLTGVHDAGIVSFEFPAAK